MKTLFAVPLHCEGCSESIKKSVDSLQCIEAVQCDLKNQLVSVTGTCAPSSIVKAIQATGKDAIVRGTGESNSAAVCILESHEPSQAGSSVKGLARIVAVSPTQALFDITLNGLPKGTYYPSIRVSGDISKGPLSAGAQYLDLGEVTVDEENDSTNALLAQQTGFSGQAFFKKTVSITELIGRSIVLSPNKDAAPSNESLVGVIARSAGVWENLKTVCSCSGKTVWQERQDAVSKGL